MRRYRVTPRARDDLKNIAFYTQQKWGKLQRNKYLKQLELRFEWLAQNPFLGKHRADICEGYYAFPQNEHLVFYRISGEYIDIIGVVHQEMDVLHYFGSID